MPSEQHETVVRMLLERPVPENPTVGELRAGFEQMAAFFPVAPEISVEDVRAGGVPAEWVRAPEASAERIVLYLHGGGYVIGSLRTHRSLVSRISAAAGAHALSLDYRLAPEHPFPAAVEDATAAYRWLLSTGAEPARIAVAGDSAGGGLTLATLLALRDAGDPLPGAGVCLSPWTDLEGTGATARPGAVDDPMIRLDGLVGMGKAYAGHDLRHPLAAPLHADYAGLPPLLIQVGTRELLLDDALRVTEKARGQGVDVTYEAWDGMIHVWQTFAGVPEADEAVEKIGAFVRARCG
jgi:monoterpene epsilon-lactone hydrolase